MKRGANNAIAWAALFGRGTSCRQGRAKRKWGPVTVSVSGAADMPPSDARKLAASILAAADYAEKHDRRKADHA